MAGKPKKRHSVTQPFDPSYRLIPLTQGQNAIVDAEDFEWLSEWNWYARWNPHTRTFYAARRNGQGFIFMHHAVLGRLPGKLVDHKNKNTLENRKENLRQATSSQNAVHARKRKTNTSGFVGVTQKRGRWCSRIMYKNTMFHLGGFVSREEAAHAYDEAAKKYFGEFAHLNFP